MNTAAHGTPQPTQQVLDSFDIALIADLGGRRDDHWLAVRSGELVVLRRSATAPFADIPFELHVLRHLHRRGWPVPHPLLDSTEMEGRTWCLFSWLPGGPRRDPGPREARDRGRLLAALHDDLEDFHVQRQRCGFAESHEVVADPRLDHGISAYERWFPDEARVMRWHLERARELFSVAELSAARRVVLHSDLAPWNLLYVGNRLTGILDFEATHRNFAVADFALSWRGTDDAVIEGYASARGLGDVDRELIAPVFWAWMFIGVADRLEAMASRTIRPTRLDWTVTNLLKRSPWMGAEAQPWVAR